MTHTALINFVESNKDFAYVYGAGIMFCNDEFTRREIADYIKEDGIMLEEIPAEELEDEGCGCEELSQEAQNGCRIIKAWKSNEEPMYIAYYD